MKKIILAVSAISLISSAMFADSTLDQTSTRLDTMQLSNYMTADGFNIFFNPANVAKHKTGAFLEIGTVDNGGATTQTKQDPIRISGFAGAFIDTGVGTFGLVLNRDNSFADGFGMATPTRQNNIDLFYGIGITEDINLGMRLTYASAERTYDNSTTVNRTLADNASYNTNTTKYDSFSFAESGSDLSLQVGGQFIGIDATVTYGVYDYSDDSPLDPAHTKITTYGPGAGLALDSNVSSIFTQDDTNNSSSDGASILEFALAYTLDLNKNSSITPYGVFQSVNYDMSNSINSLAKTEVFDTADNTQTEEHVKALDQTGSIQKSTDTLVLGAAYNLKPTENVLVVVAGEYTYAKESIDTQYTTTQDKVIDTLFVPAPTTTHTTNGVTGTTQNDSYTKTTNDLSVVVAAEAYVTESLALRFGLRESVYHNVDDDGTYKDYNDIFTNDDKKTTGNNTSTDTSTTSNDATYTDGTYTSVQPAMQLGVGFGYKATESVSIDGLINADLFLTGPDFITGQTLNGLNARLALNYNF